MQLRCFIKWPEAVRQGAMAQTSCVSFLSLEFIKTEGPRGAIVLLTWDWCELVPLPGLTCRWDRRKASTVKPEWCQVLFSRWGGGTMQGQLPQSHQPCALLFPATRSQMSELKSATGAQPSPQETALEESNVFDPLGWFCERQSDFLWAEGLLLLLFGLRSCFPTNSACFPPPEWIMLSGHPNMTVVEEIWIPLIEDGNGSFAKFFYSGSGKWHQAAAHAAPKLWTSLASYAAVLVNLL